MKSTEKLAGSEHDAGEEYRPSDAELGVGETDPGAAAADELERLLLTPEGMALVDKLVAQRLSQMAAEDEGAAAPPASGDAQLERFAQIMAGAFDRASLSTASQQPGYVRPLPAEEVEARAQAYVEMLALIERAVAEQSQPQYLLTEDFHAADILWAKGDVIFWYGPPNTEMLPRNPPAEAIFAQMLRWIGGGATHIADHVSDALLAMRPDQRQLLRQASDRDAGFYGTASETPSLSQAYKGGIRQVKMAGRVDGPRHDVGPKRVTGTVVPEGPAGASGGPVRQPSTGAVAQIGTVMPVESPSAAQHF